MKNVDESYIILWTKKKKYFIQIRPTYENKMLKNVVNALSQSIDKIDKKSNNYHKVNTF